ncbi:hypothetical protein BV22DRAFT_154508 [Leucogyrophana mollusca]|uniref:Uncharacterized protein n=1 Tax=Leucogyrophana mollusca TaxID=85980 RepID=A0ACB8BU82_9AGAM|nr:hypothetical protein BV22DRAFT_154508 [Leucogyrophana mollusca]
MLSCMWSNCGSSFTSLSELVGHVNLEHLRLPVPSAASHVADVQANKIPASLSCHWGDCSVFPSPESIPGPSTGMTLDRAIEVLTAHLMQDHLGYTTTHSVQAAHHPSSSMDSAQIHLQPVDAVDTPSHVEPPPHSPSPSPHECSGTHTCRWQNCSRTFTSCDDLTAHIVSEHVGAGKAHYDCFWEGCTRHGESGFSSKQKISRHMQSHTGHRPFQCKVCKQNFSEAATLQQHMRRHTQEKPYICDFPGCGKAFAITGALTIHKRTHNGLRPFKCTYCDKAFAESSNLSKHLRTHTGARPYSCVEDGCGKSFARPDQLARHMSVHRKKGGTAPVG